MEYTNTPLLQKLHLSPQIPLFRPNPPRISPFSYRKTSQIFAHFGRVSRRRNSLRKKLTQDQKVNVKPPLYIPDKIEPKQIVGIVQESENGTNNVEKSKLYSDSVLWRKFEDWVDQFKKDGEVWGIGSAPVFTVFQDIDGNAQKVEINEDEIDSKVLYATSLAREIEKGDCRIPGNRESSGGFVNGIREIILKLEIFSKAPRIGFMVICGLLCFWLVREVFMENKNELTREEKKMLRRKMKSRVEKEKMESGSVKVLPKVVKPVIGSGVRPRLDKQELMNSILKAKESEQVLKLSHSSSSLDYQTGNFNAKVQEIKGMARQAREIERKNKEEDEDVNENLPNDKDGSEELSGDDLSSGDFSKPIDISGSRDLERENREEDEDANEDLPTEMKDSEELSIDDLSGGDLLKPIYITRSKYIKVKNREEQGDVNEELHTEMEDLEELTVDDPIDVNAIRDLEMESIEEHKDVHEDLSNELEAYGMLNELSGRGRDSLKPIDINENREDFLSPTGEIEASVNGMKSQWEPNRRGSITLPLMDMKEVNKSFDKPMIETVIIGDPGIGSLVEEASVHIPENSDSQIPTSAFTVDGSKNGTKSQWDLNTKESISLHVKDPKKESQSSDACNGEMNIKSSRKMKPKIILSVKEAKEYLSQKDDRGKLDTRRTDRSMRLGADDFESSTVKEKSAKASKMMHNKKELSSTFDMTWKTKSDMNAFRNTGEKKMDPHHNVLQSVSAKTDDSSKKKNEMGDIQRPKTSKEYSDINNNQEAGVTAKESWMEKKFQEFEPIARKIGDGFRENFMIAKEKVQEDLNLRFEINLPCDESELEWMMDDSLRETVFQVRENELMGRDPFHMMGADDKQAFFKGLEKKVEKESGKLLNLHEYLHSRIENLDYGADGISLYDPPEKVIPRWKSPVVDRDPVFLNNHVSHQQGDLSNNTGISNSGNQILHDTLQKSVDAVDSNDVLSSSSLHISRKSPHNGISKNPKTLIESSDGSSRVGNISGKEYWQHTKKWSREFLELYNAETDPEVKSIMKDMGKDLNRWITDKEIQETADLMTQIPNKKRRYIEKKLGKLKREMEMFGPQAVVSKYREYGEEQEDYLWWLDLPFVLCIELYTHEEGAEKVGFYSLEMAEDLELDPKQYHVIAFEDPGDSKRFCYIIQAHLEMLGKGSAFVVARPPKDAFREAKTNGFNVTVIRKGELQLNVDQTLEEVEEEISVIGSKVYHDKIIGERSVDMGSLMKGVFGSSKPAKRGKSKRC